MDGTAGELCVPTLPDHLLVSDQLHAPKLFLQDWHVLLSSTLLMVLVSSGSIASKITCTIQVQRLAAASPNRVRPVVVGVLISLSAQQPSTNFPSQGELSLHKGLPSGGARRRRTVYCLQDPAADRAIRPELLSSSMSATALVMRLIASVSPYLAASCNGTFRRIIPALISIPRLIKAS